MNNNLYFTRNTYDTDVFNYTLINLTNINNNVNITIFSILLSGMAYTSDVFFPSNDAIQLLGLNNIKTCSNAFHKPMPVFHMTIKSIFPIPIPFADYLG